MGRVDRRLYRTYLAAWGPFFAIPIFMVTMAMTERGLQVSTTAGHVAHTRCCISSCAVQRLKRWNAISNSKLGLGVTSTAGHGACSASEPCGVGWVLWGGVGGGSVRWGEVLCCVVLCCVASANSSLKLLHVSSGSERTLPWKSTRHLCSICSGQLILLALTPNVISSCLSTHTTAACPSSVSCNCSSLGSQARGDGAAQGWEGDRGLTKGSTKGF